MRNGLYRVGLGLAVVALLGGCRPDPLQATSSRLRLEPRSVDFGTVYADGRPRTATLSVVNDGPARLEVSWTLASDGPFSLVSPPAELPPGASEVVAQFLPQVPGHYARRVLVEGPAGEEAEATLSAVAMPVPPCVPSTPCVTSAFDPATDTCVETSLPDGTGCDPHSVCVEAASCQQGRCVGREKRCDDGNACTVDVCNATNGCEHLPAPPCPGDGQCQVGVCHPDTGCGLAPAPDGQTCGSLQTCAAAEICLSGSCVVRDPPDGYVCAEASPCQGEGRCQGDVCVRAPASVLSPSWTFDSTQTGDPDAGTPPTLFHDFVLEGSGAATLGNFFQSPMRLRANTPEARPAPLGASRRCILWNGRLVCADYPAAPNGRVSALDLSTGQTVWTYEIQTARPDFAQASRQIFMARLVVQGSDRLAALFEAYPANTDPSAVTLCRNYYLVVLDAQGHEVMAQPVTDPLLQVCNHPHPYGVVADSVGNLFIAFSPTTSAAAPLKPDHPTLIMSYTHDGVFRWKLTDFEMVGGELAVARGLLYSENSPAVLMAATGQTAFLLPRPAGRVVVSDARLIPAPVALTPELDAYEAGTAVLRWIHALGSDTVFWSDQIRLAAWHTPRGTHTVALTFINLDARSSQVPRPALRAINVFDGSEAFTCPLALTAATAPQLFEVADGSMTVMAGALDASGAPGCEKCDPPFAGSGGTFFTVPLPGISVPEEPWLGTFGGPGHDHQEEVPGAAPAN